MKRQPNTQAGKTQGAKNSPARKKDAGAQEQAQFSKAEAPKLRPLPASFKLPVPSILLEGDRPAPAPRSGPGEKLATSPTPARERSVGPSQPISRSYGTGNLNVIARDPYCLFASWDFSDDQQRYYNALSADKHLILRAYRDSLSGSMAAEDHLSPDSRHWFLHVPEAARKYYTAIGYYLPDGAWITVRSFGPVTTQPDRAADPEPVRFGYAAAMAAPTGAHAAPAGQIEFHAPPSESRFSAPPPPAPIFSEGAVATPDFTGRAHQTIRTPVIPERAPQKPQSAPSWTEEQERALTVIITSLIKKEGLPGSLELLEKLQRELGKRPALSLAELGLLLPSSAAIPSEFKAAELPSSLPPEEEVPKKKGFWFNVNAELIIYGATEPDAQVTIGERRIRLRPDGSFSYRFALPDGVYTLPAQATSSDGSDIRLAELQFARETSYSGEVGAHPQDKALRIPSPENVV